jgi:excisionase family DNA binding protein
MKDDKAIEPLAYSPMEAARRLGVGRTTIYELIKSGELSISKLGSRTLIHDESCRRVLQSHAVETDGAKK